MTCTCTHPLAAHVIVPVGKRDAHSFARDPKKCERGTHTLRLVFTDQCLPL